MRQGAWPAGRLSALPTPGRLGCLGRVVVVATATTSGNGPAHHDERVSTHHIHATVDQGFGRVKRFLLSVSTPRSWPHAGEIVVTLRWE
jgi:hypothetical protein